MSKENVSVDFHFESRYVDVLDSKIHYIEQGNGTPILFLHGMPTSCYLWRNIIPHLSTLGRCIAPDLIGMGKSGKPNIEYQITDHIEYIEAFIEALHLKNIILVMHGWGSIMGLDYAMRHEQNCRGLIFYESYLRPMHTDDVSLPFQEQVSFLEQQGHAYDITMNASQFIDQVLPQVMMRSLSEKELSYYREPFLLNGTGKPLQQYLRELPKNADSNSHVNPIIANYSKKLTQTKVPKLLLYSIPGFTTTIATVMWAKEHIPNLEIAEVGEALHYAQENNPVLMGETMSVWLQGIE